MSYTDNAGPPASTSPDPSVMEHEMATECPETMALSAGAVTWPHGVARQGCALENVAISANAAIANSPEVMIPPSCQRGVRRSRAAVRPRGGGNHADRLPLRKKGTC